MGESSAASRRAALGPVRQIGYIVPDAEEAAWSWVRRTGVGPWRIHNLLMDECTYLGESAVVELTIASAYSNGVEVELITQRNDARSMYSEFLAAGPPGAQHVCFFPSDYDGARDLLMLEGMTTVLEGNIKSIRFEYLDDGSGQVIEIADIPQAGLDARIERAAAAAEWDGLDPVHSR